MGWIRVLAKIVRDKIKAGALDFIFEILWTVFSIVTVLVLWNSVVSRVPTGWTEQMVIAFALFLEIYYIVRSYIRDIVWLYGEYYVEGRFEPFLRPHPYLYGVLNENDGGYILASVVKLPILFAVIVLLFPKWWLGLLAFVLGMIFYVGYEMFVVGLSLLLTDSGRLWELLYSFLGYLVEIPADFYRGISRIFVTILTPVFFSVTFPAKVLFGFIHELPLLIILSIGWCAVGWYVMKLSIKYSEAYGG